MQWQILSSDQDCRQFLEKIYGLHDACLREMHLWTEHFVDRDLCMHAPPGLDMRARLLFQRQFKDPSALELLFEEIVELQIGPRATNDDSIILDADLHFSDGLFAFNGDDVVTVTSRKLSWRDASDLMGQELRYGPGHNGFSS